MEVEETTSLEVAHKPVSSEEANKEFEDTSQEERSYPEIDVDDKVVDEVDNTFIVKSAHEMEVEEPLMRDSENLYETPGSCIETPASPPSEVQRSTPSSPVQDSKVERLNEVTESPASPELEPKATDEDTESPESPTEESINETPTSVDTSIVDSVEVSQTPISPSAENSMFDSAEEIAQTPASSTAEDSMIRSADEADTKVAQTPASPTPDDWMICSADEAETKVAQTPASPTPEDWMIRSADEADTKVAQTPASPTAEDLMIRSADEVDTKVAQTPASPTPEDSMIRSADEADTRTEVTEVSEFPPENIISDEIQNDFENSMFTTAMQDDADIGVFTDAEDDDEKTKNEDMEVAENLGRSPMSANVKDEEVEMDASDNEDEEVNNDLKSQLKSVEDEEDEDLEEGEIEDDEEVPPIVKIKEMSIFLEESISKDKESFPSSSKHHHHSSSKDKGSRKNKDKENKSDKKRKHSIELREDAERSPHRDKEKLSKKRIRRLEDVVAGDEDYMFIRGASMSPPPGSLLGIGNGGRKFYETDPFGHPIYEDELESTFPGSPAESKRRRKSRSPQSITERRRREDTRGNRRPNSARKEPIKPLHKSDQICTYYMQGKCQKSHEECSFSHNAVPPRKMELCKFWMMDCCAKKEKCLYLHNDFPCKFYHTGLVCKQGQKNQCKFSHKPMNEVTKAVLLKHIETAPKEILGDFPRLNRQGALNLIAKMESKINGDLAKQERERDEDRRRTRWEQPTRDDEEKLHELMEEAGIGNYYQETVEAASQQHENQNKNRGDRERDRQHHHQQGSPSHSSLMGMAPLMGLLPNQLPPPLLPNQPHVVHNPTLANVLASLHIPSTTIQRSKAHDENENRYKDENMSGLDDEPYEPQDSGVRSPISPSRQAIMDARDDEMDDMKDELPEHLPPMQRGIFRRIQEQQIKNEKKLKDVPSDEEKPDEIGWYSSDEETDKPITDVLKGIPDKGDQDKKPVVDFASVLSAIRKTAAAASNESSQPDSKRSIISAASPPMSSFTGRGDVDFRLGPGGQRGNDMPSTSQGPFRDTDFRVPSNMRQEFKDIDLRKTEPPPEKSPIVPVFKSLPTGPATMIDAAINSHPPMIWRVRLVDGIKPIDYSYIRHTMSPTQLALDPRFGPRTAGGISLLPDPSSPPPAMHPVGPSAPTNIPGGDRMMDPRVNRRMGQPSSGGGLLSDPRLGGDPRSGAGGNQGQVPTSLLPPGWPGSVDMTQAALAAQFIAAQQLGLLPFQNPGGLPFVGSNYGDMNPNNMGGGGRPPFPHIRGSAPPSSSWERYSQQQSGGVTPPL